MRKGKSRSEVSLLSAKSDGPIKEDIFIPPMDVLSVNVIELRLAEEYSKQFIIKVSFFDQLLLSTAIDSIASRDIGNRSIMASGHMNYDPSDYEKMCLFADSPLNVTIRPLNNEDIGDSFNINIPGVDRNSNSISLTGRYQEISCCNVDILPLFIDTDRLYVRKRMEPMVTPSVTHMKSWDNLPLLTMELSVSRNKENCQHHKIFRGSNFMKITLVGAYNLKVPNHNECIYTGVTKIPLPNDKKCAVVTYNQGRTVPNNYNNLSFYPHWESLRPHEDFFTKADEKVNHKIEELKNEKKMNVESYVNGDQKYTTIWASFHRTLMLMPCERWLHERLRRYHWPFELHVFSDQSKYSFMAPLDLFTFLYPGETTIRLAVPLQWLNDEQIMEKCGCEPLVTPAPSTYDTPQKSNKVADSIRSTSSDIMCAQLTANNDTDAFIIVEVTLARPLKKAVIPPDITRSEICELLRDLERIQIKRECTGRGQHEEIWQTTVKQAVNALKRVPYYGSMDFCIVNRQLSETRTRVELSTSVWQEAAVYVNNNFVVPKYVDSEKMFEEMIMLAHACLMRSAGDALTLTQAEMTPSTADYCRRAARHARQLQHLTHATDLYLLLLSERHKDADSWRELATCLKDVDRDWAKVCLKKSVRINPRHPLTLLSKGCMAFEEDPESAEPFFVALLALYPFHTPLWIAANAYYSHRELYHMADQIMDCIKKTRAEGLAEELRYPRAWEHELGDWWDHTPLLPSTSLYYEAADLLLRLRAIKLAEICIARGFIETGESAVYCHFVALCCRLQGDIEAALCHIKTGIDKFGEISYLRSLEAECHHKQKNTKAARASFEKVGGGYGAYSSYLSLQYQDLQKVRIVLVDLLRRHPSAYSWMALADEYYKQNSSKDNGKSEESKSIVEHAIAYAAQALKWDRRAGHAWALLAKLVVPTARRQHCHDLAVMCGYHNTFDLESLGSLQSSHGHQLGTALHECQSTMCECCDHRK